MNDKLKIVNIDISVLTAFIPEQSIEREQRYVFTYTITISNNSTMPMKLLNRFWLITDADGEITKVQGEGVIGLQPEILPSKSFTYTSGCILKTPLGTMQGHYQMTDHHETSIIDIPVFQLSKPNIIH